MTTLRRTLDWMFRNRTTGAITIGQWPNLPLWLFLGLAAARWQLDPPGSAGLVLRIAAGVVLGWWAADEMLRGVNPWRRLLGGAVLAGLVLTGLRTLAAGGGNV